jgi:hypothetical protein
MPFGNESPGGVLMAGSVAPAGVHFKGGAGSMACMP